MIIQEKDIERLGSTQGSKAQMGKPNTFFSVRLNGWAWEGREGKDMITDPSCLAAKYISIVRHLSRDGSSLFIRETGCHRERERMVV